MPSTHQSLWEILTDLSRQLDRLEGQPLSEADATEAGWLLWRISGLASNALDGPKGTLRDIALVKSGGEPGPVDMDGPGRMGCQVTIQEPTPKLCKGAELGKVAPKIPPEVWNRLFSETCQVHLRPDFLEVIEEAGLPPEQREALLSLINIETNKPRVSFFEKGRSSKRG